MLLQITKIPYTISYPLRLSQKTSLNNQQQISNIIFTGYQLIRTISLILLREYLLVHNETSMCPKINNAIPNLRFPHWSNWIQINKHLATYFTKQSNDSSTLCVKIAKNWLHLINTVDTKFEHLPGIQGKATNSLDALWKFRNDMAHRIGVYSEYIEDDFLYKNYYACIEQACFIVFQECEEYFPDQDISIEKHIDHIIASMHPFCKHIVCTNIAEPFDIAMFDGVKQKSMVLYGAHTHSLHKDLFEHFESIILNKQIRFGTPKEDVKIWSITEWCNVTSLDSFHDIQNCSFYVSRPQEDQRLHKAMKQKQLLLILATTGLGKTVFIQQHISQLIQSSTNAEPVCVYIHGTELYSTIESQSNFVHMLEYKTGIQQGSFENILDFLAHIHSSAIEDTENRALYIIFDDIEKCGNINNLLQIINIFVSVHLRYPWLHVLVTMEKNAFIRVETSTHTSAKELFANLYKWAFIANSDSKFVPYLELSLLDEQSVEDCITHHRGANSPTSTQVDSQIKKILRHPCYLTLYSKLHEKHIISSVHSIKDIFELYLKQQEQFGIHQTIQETTTTICQHMIAHSSPLFLLEDAQQLVDTWSTTKHSTESIPTYATNPIDLLIASPLFFQADYSGFGLQKKLIGYKFQNSILLQLLLEQNLQTLTTISWEKIKNTLQYSIANVSIENFPELTFALCHFFAQQNHLHILDMFDMTSNPHLLATAMIVLYGEKFAKHAPQITKQIMMKYKNHSDSDMETMLADILYNIYTQGQYAIFARIFTTPEYHKFSNKNTKVLVMYFQSIAHIEPYSTIQKHFSLYVTSADWTEKEKNIDLFDIQMLQIQLHRKFNNNVFAFDQLTQMIEYVSKTEESFDTILCSARLQQERLQIHNLYKTEIEKAFPTFSKEKLIENIEDLVQQIEFHIELHDNNITWCTLQPVIECIQFIRFYADTQRQNITGISALEKICVYSERLCQNFTHVVHLHEEYSKSLSFLAYAYLKNNQYQRSVETAERALQIMRRLCLHYGDSFILQKGLLTPLFIFAESNKFLENFDSWTSHIEEFFVHNYNLYTQITINTSEKNAKEIAINFDYFTNSVESVYKRNPSLVSTKLYIPYVWCIYTNSKKSKKQIFQSIFQQIQEKTPHLLPTIFHSDLCHSLYTDIIHMMNTPR